MFVSVELLLEVRKHGQIVRAFCLVGVARLELAALRSRTVRATKLRYTPIIYMRNQFLTAFAIYINFAIFATKTSQLSQKISFVPLFFLLRHKKSIAKQSFVIYNNSRDGAWCSGSTWASDSHCVGSIPIAPANANTLTCGGVSFILLPLMLASNGQKNKRNIHAVCLR